MPQVTVSTNNVRLTRMRMALQLLRDASNAPGSLTQKRDLDRAQRSLCNAIYIEPHHDSTPTLAHTPRAKVGGATRAPRGHAGAPTPQPESRDA